MPNGILGENQNTIEGKVFDSEIVEKCKAAFEAGDAEGAARTAFLVVETRIRSSVSDSQGLFGTRLVDKAFHSEDGELSFGANNSERVGLWNLFKGAFSFLRNPRYHRFTEEAWYHPERPFELLCFANLLLGLIDQAVAENYGQFMALHEGRIRVRKVLDTDVNRDGISERIIASTAESLNEPHSWGHLTILRRNPSGWRNAPHDDITNGEHYSSLEVRDINRDGIPEILSQWYVGAHSSTLFIYRWDGQRYAKISPSGNEDYFFSNGGIDLIDVGGDGIEEVGITLVYQAEPYLQVIYKWDGSSYIEYEHRPVEPKYSQAVDEGIYTPSKLTKDINYPTL